MAVKWVEMASAVTLTDVEMTQYTAPVGTSATIQAVSVYNPTALPVTFVLYRVRADRPVEDAARICSRSVPAGTLIQGHEAINHKLEPGSRIMAVGLGLMLNVSGVEYVVGT